MYDPMVRSFPAGGRAPGAASQQTIPVILWNSGQRQDLNASTGERLMVVLKRAGLNLQAVCGGKGVCGTCKVAFPPEWAGRLPQPETREQRLLAYLQARPDERLSCRILLTPDLRGLEVNACD